MKQRRGGKPNRMSKMQKSELNAELCHQMEFVSMKQQREKIVHLFIVKSAGPPGD